MATKCYKTYMDEVEFSELGDDITLTTSIDGHNIMAHTLGDKVRKCFISIHSRKTFEQMWMASKMKESGRNILRCSFYY